MRFYRVLQCFIEFYCFFFTEFYPVSFSLAVCQGVPGLTRF